MCSPCPHNMQFIVYSCSRGKGEGGGGAEDVTEDGRREEKEETVESMREGNPSPETHHHG